MKRFLKPTGRILTTAVFTSTAFETLIPDTVVPTPIPDPLPTDTEWQVTQESSAPEKASTIIPPEALSTQEFAPISLENTGDSQINLETYTPQLSVRIDEAAEPWETELAHTSPSLPSIQFDIESADLSEQTSPLELGANYQLSEDSALRDDTIDESDESILSSLSSNAPSLPDSFDLASSHQPVSSLDEAIDLDEDVLAIDDISLPDDSFLSDDALSAPSSEFRLSSSDPSSSEDAVTATRAWLDETLSQIVMRDRMNRESQLRDNLMMSAQDYIAQGNIEQVQRIADNPVLQESDRSELLTAIADAETPTYPFVSVEQARFISRQSVRQRPLPSRDWLLSQMDTVAANLNPSCDADNDILLSSADSDTTQFAAQNPVQHNTFLSGGAFLAGIGHQPPSAANKNGLPPVNGQSYRARQQRDCTPTIGQNIGGLTVATLSGYQWLNQTAPQQGSSLRMVLPLAVPATITSHFGWRTHPIYGGRRFHFGIDFGAPMGTPILAAMPGRVETSHHLDGYGLTVILENQDLEQRTLYAHMSGIAVQPGDWIEQGDIIGWVGSTGNSTGPHLHFEVHQRQGNDWVAIDPLQAAVQLTANRRSTRIQ